MQEQVQEPTVETTKKPRKQRSDKGQKRSKPYNLKKNKETV